MPLSALEHYAYCPRQAGLILLEDAFAEDAATVRGTLAHHRVHDPGHEQRPRVRTLRALPVWHDQLGLTGVCDVVEVHAEGTVVPVEHKSGAYTPGGPADVQVGAQAMCLEQRMDTTITTAAVYTMADRRRHTVAVDAALRERVRTTAEAVRAVMAQGRLPAPAADQRCRRCSMNTGCMPKVLAKTRRYERLLADLYTPAPETEWDD
ncbi:CRISPR-associated exonuclease Cas4 [Streptomonospora nanhaiensis]|uniref:CRISPR-associated exonuclease Cas4 n=1 Tax=Streptomonospora nanhaiensis TaxID=1323731 RepID=A0A853BVK0_9ACTN|nr:CRISPR-associated exonuclease Cas4 [Streptomonospora nanhaiensis]